MTKHPNNKYQRKLIEEKKKHFVNEKKGTLKAQRPTKVWRKLALEEFKAREAEQELRHASLRTSNQS